MFRIGDFSRLSKTTIKTLRYYDEEGLLKPQRVDVITNYRYYTTEQLVQLHGIQSLRQAGLSVTEIKAIRAGSSAAEILLRRKAELETDLAHTQHQLSCIEFILSGRDTESAMTYSAIIKEIPEYMVFSKKACIPTYETCMELIPAIGKAVAAANPDLKCVTPDYCFRIDLDREYRDHDINIEYCQAVEEKGVDVDDIIFKTIPAVTVVSVMHKGAYENLGQAYAFVFRWIEENGYETTGEPPRESYIDGIWNKPDVKDWLTEIQVPVLKK